MAKAYDYEDAFTQMKSTGRSEGKAEGELRGKAKMLLLVLRQRGLDVSPEVRAAILGCRDDQQLNHWIDKQLSVSYPEELFE